MIGEGVFNANIIAVNLDDFFEHSCGVLDRLGYQLFVGNQLYIDRYRALRLIVSFHMHLVL